MQKRFLTGILALWLMVSLLPASALAADNGADGDAAGSETALENKVSVSGVVDSGFCGENLTWKLEKAQYLTLTISGTGRMADYPNADSVPWRRDGEAIHDIIIQEGVTSIGDYAFCSSGWAVKSINIPDSVTSIGRYAFSNCSYLTSINIPDGVTDIGDYAFQQCSRLSNITLPSSMGSIGDGAFGSCYELTGIVIPDGVTNIANSLFYGCRELANVSIPNGVTAIGNSAFSGCSNLTGIVIPDGVTSIGYYAFSGCSNLTGIVIPDGVTSIGYNAFSGCASLKSVVLPGSAVELGGSIFAGCSNLTSAGPIGGNYALQFGHTDKIPSSLCADTGIKSVAIPDSVTEIGNWAFQGCSGLADIVLPAGLVKIGNGAFRGCSSLRSVVIPESVTTLGSEAFKGCSGLVRVIVPDSVVNTHYGGNGTGIFSGCTSLTSAGPIGGDYEIQFGHTDRIPGALFMGSCIKSIKIPDSVTAIGNSAFRECSSLTSIIIPESVQYMEFDVFKDCTSLISAGPVGGDYNIQFGWTSRIPPYAFDGASIKTAVIPDGMAEIGYNAFNDCSSLSSVIIPNGVYFGTDSSGNDVGMFYGCSSLISAGPIGGNYNIQFGWNAKIPSLAFYNSDVVSVTIPDGVTEIGHRAFLGCGSLANIELPDSVTKIGEGAFRGCASLTNIELPDRMTTIGDYAFQDCTGLTNAVIPDKVTSLGMDAFRGCTGLTNVIIPGSVEIRDGNSWTYGLFSGCTGLTNAGPIGRNYNIQYGWTSEIPSRAFYGSEIAGIIIPKEIVRIQSKAFYNCSKLTDVYYSGSENDWKAILVGNENESLANATIHYNSTGPDGGLGGDTPVKPTPPPQIATDTSIRKIGGTYHDTIVGTDVEWAADFGWDYFVDSEHYKSTKYNSELAKVSLALCASLERSFDSTKAILEGYGSSGLECTGGATKFEELSPGIAIASKSVVYPDNTFTRIFIIVLRGTTTDDDIWNDVGSGLFWNDWGVSGIEGYISDYISKYGATTENTKFLVTGHSLGGACANIVARDLSEAFGVENVFAYTFAAPSPCRNKVSGEYNNIFNFLCFQDNVPLCLSTRSNWHGYGKYNWFGYENRTLANCYCERTGEDWRTTYDKEVLFRLHAPSAYYAYLLCAHRPFSSSDIRYGVCIKCPVDVWVYDSGGNLVGHIQDDKVDFDNYAGSVMLAVEDTAKYVYLTGNDTYTFKITGTDTGTMTYTAFSVDMNTNAVVETKIYSNVQIENNKTFTSIVGSNDETDTGKVEIPDVQLFVLGSDGEPEREVLPDGNGTEVPWEDTSNKGKEKFASYEGFDFYRDTAGNITCLDSTGAPVINDFKCDGIYTYYFQADGTAMKDRLTYHPDGVHVIYFDREGHEAFDSFALVGHNIPSMETGIATELNEYCYFNTFGYQYTDVVTYDVKGEKLYYANTGGVLERSGWFNFSGTVTYAGDGKPWSAAGQRGYANGDCTLMKDTFSYDENGNLCYMQGNGAVTYDF